MLKITRLLDMLVFGKNNIYVSISKNYNNNNEVIRFDIDLKPGENQKNQKKH